MKETIHKLKIKGLYVISMKISSFRYCKLMAERHDLPLRNYTSRPIEKITDFIELFNNSLTGLDWDVDEYTEEHGRAIMDMERSIKVNDFNGRLFIPLRLNEGF